MDNDKLNETIDGVRMLAGDVLDAMTANSGTARSIRPLARVLDLIAGAADDDGEAEHERYRNRHRDARAAMRDGREDVGRALRSAWRTDIEWNYGDPKSRVASAEDRLIEAALEIAAARLNGGKWNGAVQVPDYELLRELHHAAHDLEETTAEARAAEERQWIADAPKRKAKEAAAKEAAAQRQRAVQESEQRLIRIKDRDYRVLDAYSDTPTIHVRTKGAWHPVQLYYSTAERALALYREQYPNEDQPR